MARKAVVLLSGGTRFSYLPRDCSRLWLRNYALSFDYGQRHQFELQAARQVAAALGATAHHVVTFDLRAFGGSALTSAIEVPKGRPTEEMSHDIPITYVPARNTIFLSFALAWAEVFGHPTSLSESTRSITAVTRTVAQNIFAHTRAWRISRQRQASKVARDSDPHTADLDDESGDHPRRYPLRN